MVVDASQGILDVGKPGVGHRLLSLPVLPIDGVWGSQNHYP